jgi:hypothetical protein
MLQTFRRAAEKWADITSPLKRVALGGTFYERAVDGKEGLSRLREILPSGFELPDIPVATDVSIQLNWPRPSRIGTNQLVINRLCKWSVEAIVVMEITDLGQPRPAGEAQTVCRLVSDLNTPAAFDGAFSGDELKRVLAELFEWMRDILVEGLKA